MPSYLFSMVTKIFEQSFLSIYFLTVKTYFQGGPYSVGMSEMCLKISWHAVQGWLKSTDGYFSVTVMDDCLPGVLYND